MRSLKTARAFPRARQLFPKVGIFQRVRFFLVEPKSCFHAGAFGTHWSAIASICRRPASLDLGLAFKWPISRARRQMRGDRIKCLGLRTDRTSCIECDRFDLSPRTNGKAKCSETRPMGAGRRQIESVALCVWQCHLRNVSTLSNRTHPLGRWRFLVGSAILRDVISKEKDHHGGCNES